MYRFLIKGTVQGVGFRPAIRNACVERGLRGYVQNTGEGVTVEVNDREGFLEILKRVPPQARIDSFEVTETENNFEDFTIRESSGAGFAEIPADLFLCGDCERELHDPQNRRHKYFFITCVNCGPRFSITCRSPYDRHTTTMGAFRMCAECRREYEDPDDRRYHAQTIACHRCGPRLSLLRDGKPLDVEGYGAVRRAAGLIREGQVLAIKGIGGFHLCCRIDPSTSAAACSRVVGGFFSFRRMLRITAGRRGRPASAGACPRVRDREPIARLREITGRTDKPYAVMCRDTAMAESIALLNPAQKRLLCSVERPIVVVPKRADLPAVRHGLSEVSELDTVGIMLPYTALHYLLFDFIAEPLVMTSSNISDEPITTEDREQIVEYVLTHDRVIENPVDDSVVKVIGEVPLFLRRSRGYVPQTLPMRTQRKEQILAMGAELSNTFCILKHGRAVLSQYMGTTSNAETFEHYKKMLRKFLAFTDCSPDVIVADLHPTYLTGVFAEELSKERGISLERVQHHRAHAYSVAGEHGLTDFSAIVCDGLGYGDDGTIWGGEVFVNDERVGHLECHAQLGGDSATVRPVKMLFSILSRFLSVNEIKTIVGSLLTERECAILQKQLEEGFNCPLTSSCGRVLDAASVLLGFCAERTYEGRPAMMLEAHSSEPFQLPPVIENNVLMTTPLFQFLVGNIHRDPARLAATVQQYVAEGLYAIAATFGKPVVFSGGCAYSRVMTEFMLKRGVLMNKDVPPGDGGISFGQIAFYLANARNDVP